MSENFNVVYLGSDGFPVGLAEIQKIKLVSKSLIEVGGSVTVISRNAVHAPSPSVTLKKSGKYGEIDYVFASGTPFKPKSFVKRNLLKVWGAINEVFIIRRLNRKKKIDFAIVSSKRFGILLLYRFLSKLLGFKVLLNFAEYNSELRKEKGKKKSLNDSLFEKYGFNYVDGVIPISELLLNFVRKNAPNKPCLKIPVLCDFDKFEQSDEKQNEQYFLFCGAPNFELISFILNAYDTLNNHSDVHLYLVVNGPAAAQKKLKSCITKIKNADKVRTFSKLPYPQLVSLYSNAMGLLIPLRPTLRDIARFPHKIGEYTASGNPIVTTNVGEVKNYFEDEQSALIAENYDEIEFAKKMNFILEHPDRARKIGEGGKTVGLENFDYRIYGEKIKSFVISLP
ncbi:glycosyltransferase [Fulvivirgaceae bacterium BMA10]|uniref:Glycosyltransferase n=1 Tax=Splendidivirga corallicola TaxID=3051826 RepID=A0ABT8L1A7_9BACT|nr:glycosyltransferase [Fulvivirgaceae bacterium BMA10]